MSNDQYQDKEKLWPEYVRVVEKNYSIDEAVMDRMCVELIEDEIDRELERELDEDLKSWVDHSEGGADELAKLSLLRQVLKKSDDVPMPESGSYYDALESRIMASLDECIDAGDVQEHGAPSRDRVRLPSNTAIANDRRRSFTARAGQFVILAGLALLSTGKWPQQIVQGGREKPVSGAAGKALRATRQAAPKVLTGTVMSFESDADLALEIAARRLVAYHKGE